MELDIKIPTTKTLPINIAEEGRYNERCDYCEERKTVIEGDNDCICFDCVEEIYKALPEIKKKVEDFKKEEIAKKLKTKQAQAIANKRAAAKRKATREAKAKAKK